MNQLDLLHHLPRTTSAAGTAALSAIYPCGESLLSTSRPHGPVLHHGCFMRSGRLCSSLSLPHARAYCRLHGPPCSVWGRTTYFGKWPFFFLPPPPSRLGQIRTCDPSSFPSNSTTLCGTGLCDSWMVLIRYFLFFSELFILNFVFLGFCHLQNVTFASILFPFSLILFSNLKRCAFFFSLLIYDLGIQLSSWLTWFLTPLQDLHIKHLRWCRWCRTCPPYGYLRGDNVNRQGLARGAHRQSWVHVGLFFQDLYPDLF